MTFILVEGNLASTPKLQSRIDGRHWVKARILETSQIEHDGKWEDAATTAYTVIAFGTAALNLVRTATNLDGHLTLIVAGDLTVTTNHDGTPHNTIKAHYLGVSLTRHELEERR
jgi:single-stranded DNA-binding protein